MAYDINIYEWLLEDILQVQPTGDPVNDSVYLVLLPMVVLYMFISHVVGNSRFGNKKIEFIIMFVIGFFIIREGFYELFASLSLPLLIVIIIWHTFSFITGRSKKGDVKRDSLGNIIAQPGSGYHSGNERDFMNWLADKTNVKGAINTWNIKSKDDAKEALKRLNISWRASERIAKMDKESVPPDTRAELEKILTRAVDILTDFNDKDKNELMNNLDKDFKEELKTLMY